MSMGQLFARSAAVLLAGAALTGPALAGTDPANPPAKPAHHAHHHRRVASRTSTPAQPAPVPVASNTTPAPVPNDAVTPPDAPTPRAEVAPSVFALHYPPVGEGYVTGSSSQAMDDRNAAKATGVQATIPLN